MLPLKNHHLMLAGALFAGATLMACDPEPGDGEPRPVDHESVSQSLRSNLENAIDSIADAILAMENSNLLGDLMSPSEYCYGYGTDDPMDEWVEECETGPSASEELQEVRAELIELLETRVFPEAHVEEEGGDFVIYLLSGDVLCGDAEDFWDPADHQACVDEIDELELRIRARSLAANAIDLDLKIGPTRISPASFRVSPSEVSLSADLDAMVPLMEYLDDLYEGEMAGDLPDRLEGRLRMALLMSGSETKVALAIDRAIHIEADELKLALGATPEFFAASVDAAAETAALILGVGSVDIEAEHIFRDAYAEPPMPDYDYDSGEGEDDGSLDPMPYPEESDPVPVALRLAGATASLVADLANEDVTVEGIGLGGGPAELDIDGENVVSIHLANDFDLGFSISDDEVEFDVSPGFDLQVALQLYRALDHLNDVDDWMLDDLIRVALTGDANPAIALGEFGLQVLRGQLHIQSQAAAIDIQVDAGMCLIEDEYDYDYEASYHPFEHLSAGQCE